MTLGAIQVPMRGPYTGIRTGHRARPAHSLTGGFRHRLRGMTRFACAQSVHSATG